jgi:hypothetical protein
MSADATPQLAMPLPVPSFITFAASAIPTGDVRAIKVQRYDNGETLSFVGRAAWALAKLATAGRNGCTPIDHPGPRWSHYTWLLRKAGLDVETIHEGHGGPYTGHHARYVLKTALHVLAIEEAA